MRVAIRHIEKKENERVLVECVEVTPEIQTICSYIQSFGTELSGTTQEGHLERFSLHSVYYFEALDEKVFAYTKSKVFEVRFRLYEIAEAYKSYHFARCSKSIVLNLMLLDGISPALNGRFFAHMKNGEKLMISRQYAPVLKQIIMEGLHNEKTH